MRVEFVKKSSGITPPFRLAMRALNSQISNASQPSHTRQLREKIMANGPTNSASNHHSQRRVGSGTDKSRSKSLRRATPSAPSARQTTVNVQRNVAPARKKPGQKE